jgi:hypothetical protein
MSYLESKLLTSDQLTILHFKAELIYFTGPSSPEIKLVTVGIFLWAPGSLFGGLPSKDW